MKNTYYIFIALAFVFIASTTLAQSTSTIDTTDILNSVNADLIDPVASNPPPSGGFSRDGVYGCNGASYSAVGVQGPTGSFVPVFDGALFDQQRLLTYKECVLDGIAASNREALIAQVVGNVVTVINKGRDGNPAFVTNLGQRYLEEISDPTAREFINGPATETIPEAFRGAVRRSLLQEYSNSTRNPQNKLRCGVTPSEMDALAKNNFDGAGGWKTFYTFISNPACNAYFSSRIASEQMYSAITNNIDLERTQLLFNNGFISNTVDEVIDIGGGRTVTRKRVVTPGYLIAQQLSQVLGTGLRQAENADEIDQMISGLMLNIGTEMLGDLLGFSGLSTSIGGQPSYVERVSKKASNRAREKMVGVGAATINNTIRIEEEYRQARLSSLTILSQSQQQLVSWENTCWDGMLTKVNEEVKNIVTQRVCPGVSTTTPCTLPVTVDDNYSSDIIVVQSITANGIIISGITQRKDSTIDISVIGGDKTIDVPSPTVDTEGFWKTELIDTSIIPDGSFVVSASEILSNGAGTLNPVLAQLYKKTSPSGVILTLPTDLPAVTSTATSGSITESLTLLRDSTRSNSVISQNITPIIAAVELNIERSNTALEVLFKMRDALNATTSSEGQRVILEQLDQLISKGLLHSESDSRNASTQTTDIDTTMQQLLETTRVGWEAGWCKTSNWSQYIL